MNSTRSSFFLTGLTFFLFFFLSHASSAQASTYLELDDEAYTLLSRLEAEGVIRSAILSIRPISRQEAVRLLQEAENNAKGRSAFIQSIILALKRRVKPEQLSLPSGQIHGSFYATYIWNRDEAITLSYPGARREIGQTLTYNNSGDRYNLGSNGRTGFTARLENAGPFSVYLNPELKLSDGVTQGVLKSGYVVLGAASWLDLVAGKDSQWWGPGYNGAILLTNNAAPPPMLKITAPDPFLLPFFFKYLGPFQYSMFVSQLENDRSDFARPYLWGLRMSFKPHPAVEIGLERTALLGGRGRPLDTSTIIESIFGSREHTSGEDPGDQRAGFDIIVTLPFGSQPVQAYWERDGEENRQRNLRSPYKSANLYGLYLPRLLGLERIGFRAEYASDHVNEQPYVWYTHGVYSAGYTYNGMIIGHPMGTDAHDLFLQLSCLLPEHSAQLFLSYDQMTHNVEGPVSESTDALSATAKVGLSSRTTVDLTAGIGRVENPGNEAGPTRTVSKASAQVRYEF
jgi:hypothetical protein